MRHLAIFATPTSKICQRIEEYELPTGVPFYPALPLESIPRASNSLCANVLSPLPFAALCSYLHASYSARCAWLEPCKPSPLASLPHT